MNKANLYIVITIFGILFSCKQAEVVVKEKPPVQTQNTPEKANNIKTRQVETPKFSEVEMDNQRPLKQTKP
jgi:hypothetical protein